ncbi:hypothetical protein LTS08_004011 [Lithohypha guttulata]|nr:hypothetical protein LTS08_004011 [Lithohypha guttulata]
MKQRISYIENKNSRNDHVETTPPYHHTFQHQPGIPEQSGASASSINVAPSGTGSNVAVNEVEYLSLAAMSGGGANDQTHWQSSTLKQLMESVISIQGINPASVTMDVIPSTQNMLSLSDLQSGITAVTRKDCHFLIRNFARSFPCISEQESLTAFDTAVRSEESATDSESALAPTPGVIAIASSALALGGIISPFHSNLQLQLLALVDKAKRALPVILTTMVDATAIQCLTLQSMLSLYFPSAGSAWHLLGLALTRAISAGLHQASSHTSAGEDSYTTNIFWTLYLLDRTLAHTMGRPFGLMDDDIALKFPEVPAHHSLDDTATVSKAIFTLKLHHALLLSRWRQSPVFDLATLVPSYEYWRDSYHEMCEHFIELEIAERQDEDVCTLSGDVSRKDEAQLSCRALVQLLARAIEKPPADHDSLVRLKQYIVTEAPQLIDTVHKSIDSGNAACTFLDGHDAFAAAVVYVFSAYETRQPSSFRLDVSQMRTVGACIAIIQYTARQFKPMRSLISVIWALLHTLEAKATLGDGVELFKEMSGCEVPIPKHIGMLLEMIISM